jgi:hypothetical protein
MVMRVVYILTTVFTRLSFKCKKARIVSCTRNLSFSNDASAYNFVKNKLIVHERNQLQIKAMFFYSVYEMMLQKVILFLL